MLKQIYSSGRDDNDFRIRVIVKIPNARKAMTCGHLQVLPKQMAITVKGAVAGNNLRTSIQIKVRDYGRIVGSAPHPFKAAIIVKYGFSCNQFRLAVTIQIGNTYI
jgi:hypothetical protein